METSFANGGQLSASNAEVWNHLAHHRQGPEVDAARATRRCWSIPKPSWHKLSWFAEFMAAIPHYRRNTVATARLAIAAREHLFGWAEAEGIDFDLKQRGILHIYRDQASFDHAGRVIEAAGAGRAAAPGRHAGRNAGHRADPGGRLLRRLLHRKRLHRRHPQIHHRPGRGRGAARRALPLRAGGDAIASRSRRPGRITRDGGRRAPCAPFDARGGLRRHRQPRAGRQAGRPRQHLSGQGLLDHRQPERRRQPGGRAHREPARRRDQAGDQPPGRGPLPRGRHGRIQRLQPRHPRRPHPSAGGMGGAMLPGRQHAPASCPGPACGR